MDKKELISDINNLLIILLDFCQKTEQTEEINAICSLLKVLHEKSEVLYTTLYN